MTINLRLIIFRFHFSAILIALLFAWNLHAGDWLSFRGPKFDGSTTDGKFATVPGGQLAVNWRIALGPGYSGISILNGKAVTMFSDGTNNIVAAFDMNSGKELWRYPVAPTYEGYGGSHDGPSATPTLADGKVFAFDRNGTFVALDLASGNEVWKANVESFGARKPFHGFTTSPVVAKDVVVVQLGGEKGKSIAGLDIGTGKLKWTVGDDMVSYQSPVLIQSSGRQLVLAVNAKKLFVIDPATGTVVLEYEHGGDDAADVMVPALLDEDRVLLRNKWDSSDLIRLVNRADGKLSVEKIWTKGVFKNSLCVPVYHKGYLYGYNGRVLTGVDASTGEVEWRSRSVGDGWVLLVNDQLVIQTKMGSLHVGPASPGGWKETARVDLFKDVSWTHPSFAGGTIFTRSQKELARLEWRNQPVSVAPVSTSMSLPSNSEFGKFLTEVEASQDKKTVVDKFFASQKFPLVEWPDRVTFVYRGAVEDLAIAGDLQGYEGEAAMQKVPGTDVFYYTTRLEPDVRINYRFVKNYDEMICDPSNPRATKDALSGDALSWIGMPAWNEPAHLKEAPAGKRGRLEKQEMASKIGSAKFEVYLPTNYDKSQARYPAVYIFDGTLALSEGKITTTLDNLIGNTVQPVMAVFLTELKTGAKPEERMEEAKAISDLLVKEVIPFVDSCYRTAANAESRAIMASFATGYAGMHTVFNNPGVFGGIALQSIMILEDEMNELIAHDAK